MNDTEKVRCIISAAEYVLYEKHNADPFDVYNKWAAVRYMQVTDPDFASWMIRLFQSMLNTPEWLLEESFAYDRGATHEFA